MSHPSLLAEVRLGEAFENLRICVSELRPTEGPGGGHASSASVRDAGGGVAELLVLHPGATGKASGTHNSEASITEQLQEGGWYAVSGARLRFACLHMPAYLPMHAACMRWEGRTTGNCSRPPLCKAANIHAC